MSIALAVVADGRDSYLDQAVTSAREHLVGPITERWLFDDTGDDTYRRQLAARYPDFQVVGDGPRRGFAGATGHVWDTLTASSTARWVFHLEQDFTFNRALDLDELTAVMSRRPYLLQLALRRQPWNPQEAAAGGVVEQHPQAYTERSDTKGRRWLEHRLFFTTNPSIYRRSLCATRWPLVPHSEGEYGQYLLRNGAPGVPADRVAFGFWGARDTTPWVHHIGDIRAGKGY